MLRINVSAILNYVVDKSLRENMLTPSQGDFFSFSILGLFFRIRFMNSKREMINTICVSFSPK